MLIASCSRCQTHYKLPLNHFHDGGRMVRCHQCGLEWFQSITSAKEWPDNLAEIPEEQGQEQQQDVSPLPDAILPQKEAESAHAFMQVLSKTQNTPVESLPPLTMMAQDGDAGLTPDGNFMDAKPGGLNPIPFGVCIFFLMLFVTLIPTFLLRSVIVPHYPSFGMFYNMLGFHIKAPGEGLKLSGLNAEMRTIASVPTLLISGNLSNITAEKIDLPLLSTHVIALDDKESTPLKTWKFKLERKSLGAGEDIPLSLSFTDLPKDVKRIQVTVAER